ncbi:MAG TPA: phosphate/phosphite/phosphonate ABC transporter substrate-binding protein [Bryobacteraceae bacterium]|nr:phosphate/phosphite/phosphonate ABC transporter substrate-binding protein [Bryobacteraceae bacterium]
MRYFHALLIVLLALALAACHSSQASTGSGGRPSVIRYAYSAMSEDPDAAAHRIQPLKRYLERTLRARVDAVLTTNYSGVIEAFRAHKIDVASISPFSYILAAQKTPIEAIVMNGDPNGGPAVYTGSLAVARNSPVRNLEDVIRHSKELTISFVDPDSASGFLVQNAYLQSQGIEPQRDFRKVMFTMNHLASIMTLKAGKVDVAAVNERMLNRWIQSGKLAAGDIRIVWTSPSIPNQPTAVSKSLPRPFIEEIRRAFLEMQQKDPSAFAARYSKMYSGFARAPYVRADDSMFDGLRQMARNVPNLNLLEH